MHRWILALSTTMLTATLLTGIACGGDEEEDEGAGTESISVELDDFFFGPNELNGEVGKPIQINLENAGDASHTFTIDELDIDQTLAAGEEKTLTVTPKANGDLVFYCRFHGSSNGMEGTLSVSGGSGGASPTSSSTKNSSGESGY